MWGALRGLEGNVTTKCNCMSRKKKKKSGNVKKFFSTKSEKKFLSWIKLPLRGIAAGHLDEEGVASRRVFHKEWGRKV